MAEYQLTRGNLEQVFYSLSAELDNNQVLLVKTHSGNTGRWGMARLWRSWMEATAKFMAANGCTMPLMISPKGEPYGKRPFAAEDAHELFTSRWLGVDADGTRLSWSKAGHDGMRAATKGERFNALRCHEAWATERGIQLFSPRDSEYRMMQEEQDQ